MVGVKPLESMHRAAADSISKAPQLQVTAPVRPVTIRPYKLDGPKATGQDLQLNIVSIA